MDINALMVITMGMAFYFIPMVLLVATLAFTWQWRARSSSGTRDPFPREAIKDPLLVSGVLLASGVAMVAFLTGRLSAGDYFSVPVEALSVLGEAITDWEDALSAEAIALRGGVLIALSCTIVVLFSVLSHFRRRLNAHGETRVEIGGG